MKPLVSIICPTLNGARWIARAIESVRSQTFRDWELIIVDDGSTDGTEEVVHQYMHQDSRIRYVRNGQNTGVQKASNRGLREAQAPYIARIDDDDIWSDTQKLEKQYAFLNSRPDYGFVGTGVIAVNEQNQELFRFIGPQTDKEIRNQMLYRNCFANSTVLLRRELALAVGGYDESKEVKHLEDYDLWLRMGTKAKFANLPIYAIRFALRGASLSGQNKREQLYKQRQLIKRYKDMYPRYLLSYTRSTLRFALYALFGSFIQGRLRHWFIAKYKNL